MSVQFTHKALTRLDGGGCHRRSAQLMRLVHSLDWSKFNDFKFRSLSSCASNLQTPLRSTMLLKCCSSTKYIHAEFCQHCTKCMGDDACASPRCRVLAHVLVSSASSRVERSSRARNALDVSSYKLDAQYCNSNTLLCNVRLRTDMPLWWCDLNVATMIAANTAPPCGWS